MTDTIADMIRAAVREGITEALAEADLDRDRPRQKLFTISDAALALGMSEPTMRKLIARGMPAVKVLSATRVELSAALEWLRAGHGADGGEDG